MNDPFYGVVAPLLHDILEAAARCKFDRSDEDGEEGFAGYDPEVGCLRQLGHREPDEDDDEEEEDEDAPDEEDNRAREIAVCLECLSRDIARARELGEDHTVSVDEWHVVAEASAVLLELLVEAENIDRIAQVLEIEFGKDGDELMALVTQILFLDCVKSASIVVCLALEIGSCKEAALRCEAAVNRLDAMLSEDPPAFRKNELRADIALLQETIQAWKAVPELAAQTVRHEPFFTKIEGACADEMEFLADGETDADEEIPLSLAAAEAQEMNDAESDEYEIEDGRESLQELANHLGFFRGIFLSAHRCPE